jgi:hypothetical protein
MRRLASKASKTLFARGKEGDFDFGFFSGIPAIDRHRESDTERYSSKGIAACFLGNKAENEDLLVKSIFDAIYQVSKARREFHPEDPTPVTDVVEASPEFKKMVRRIEKSAGELTDFLKKYSLPFFSMRYQGHMNWDLALPAIIGYFTAMLQNPNNVSIQGSTATTLLERMVGLDICGMIGFDVFHRTGQEDCEENRDTPWAHITCDGTVANMESVWSTRELKFFAIGIQDAVRDAESNPSKIKGRCDEDVHKALKHAAEIQFAAPNGQTFGILDQGVDTWFLLNLDCDRILSMPGQIAQSYIEGKDCNSKDDETLDERVWEFLLSNYSLAARGFYHFCQRFVEDQVRMPVVIVPSSKHYSWPKSTSILGLGYESDPSCSGSLNVNGLLNVFVDPNGRMCMKLLREKLVECSKERIPVLQVVAVIGSTEESAVDPLCKIIELREEFRSIRNASGDTISKEDEPDTFMDFNIHADAAWGGYLLSAIRRPYEMPMSIKDVHEVTKVKLGEPYAIPECDLFNSSGVLLSDHTIRQMKAIRKCNSVTIDPHKWGYVPYPAGSLSYRNGLMTNLVTFGAPYIGSDEEKAGSALSMGESGIEGSKPGAAAAAVYLSHCVLRPDRTGYGQLMEGALFNAKMFFLHLLRIGKDFEAGKTKFKTYVLGERNLPQEFWEHPLIRRFMDHDIDDGKFVQKIGKHKHLELIRSIGPDQSTLAYAFNVLDNQSLCVANELNAGIFGKLYPDPQESDKAIPIKDFKMFVTMTTFKGAEYGRRYMKAFAQGLGVQLDDPADSEINCLRSVVMDPWMVNTLHGAENFIGSTLIPALLEAAEKAYGTLPDFIGGK